MVGYGHGAVGFALTLIGVVFALFACIVSLVIVIVILHYQYHHRRLKREEKINLVLSFHLYSVLFIFAILRISVNIQTLIGDVYGNDFNSTWCILQGYFGIVLGSSFYFIFVVQGVFRLCRIVYSNYRWLQSYWIFAGSASVLFLGASILISPLLVWHDIVYLPNEHYCYFVLRNIRSTLWIMVFCYLMPVISLLLIHIRITIFLRRQPTNLAVSIKERQQRDLMIFRRIFLSIGVLFVLGFPGTVVALMSFIAGIAVSLDQRITLSAADVSVAVLSIEMVLMAPQLNRLVMRKRQQIRVNTIDDGIPMGTVANVQ